MSQQAKSHKKVPQKILLGVILLLLALCSAVAMTKLSPEWWVSVCLLTLITAGAIDWYTEEKGGKDYI